MLRLAMLGGMAFACLATLAAAGATRASAMLTAGRTAPNIAGPSVIGGKHEAFDLSAAVGNQAVVLYFFPKAFTSG